MTIFTTEQIQACTLDPEGVEDFKAQSEMRAFRDPVYGDIIVTYVRPDGVVLIDSVSITGRRKAEPRSRLEILCEADVYSMAIMHEIAEVRSP